MWLAVILMLAVASQDSSREAATFTRRAAEFDARAAALEAAPQGEAAAAAALAWLRGLRGVLQAIPFEKPTAEIERWLKRHDALIVYSEPAGQWLISPNLLDGVHRQYKASRAADEIAWLAVDNGIPGECEGYIPCYANGLNTLHGEYLRLHPRGTHGKEALDQIDESLRNALELLKEKDHADFLSVPRDCGDLLAGARPLRAAVVGAGGAKTGTIVLIDRLIALCPQ